MSLETKLKNNWNFLSFAVYFVEKCYRDDPDIDECLKFSGNKLASYLHEGIPELDLVDVEPVLIDGKFNMWLMSLQGKVTLHIFFFLWKLLNCKKSIILSG